MIDALLYAVRDGIRNAGFNYGTQECDITADGHPHPRCGNVFVAIHGGTKRPGGANLRNLHEVYGFSVTLTMRVTIPLDKVGEQLIARNLALVPLAQRQGFDAKEEQLRAFLHMNWALVVLQGQNPNSANDNLAAWATGTVYGFVTPVAYQMPQDIALVGGEWFSADPESADIGIRSELRFDGAERLQPQVTAAGSFL